MQSVIKPPRPSPARPAKEALADLYAAYNAREWDAVAARLDPGVEWFHAGRHELVRGVESVVAMLRSNAEAFPSAQIDVRKLHAVGATVVAEWTVVNARSSMTTDGDKPAIVCEVVEVANGRIVRGSTYGDILTMMMEFRDEYRPPLRAVC
jgi:ketosteroid isomerase-like protein